MDSSHLIHCNTFNQEDAMPTIEIDLDVYEFLQSQVRGFRETESTVLRRLLKLPQGQTASTELPVNSPLASFVTEPAFQAKRTATDRYLALLGFACNRDPAKFSDMPDLVAGRQRAYIGQTRDEIEKYGKSTHPRQIPGTKYWAMTNADTQQKRDTLRKILTLLDYSNDDMLIAENSLRVSFQG